jgi:hypothetical protein
MSAAALFLGHTGDLQLTDQQVTKLAGIARRSAERHKAMRASFDSAAHAMMGGGRPMRGDTAGQGARRTAMMEAFKKAHEAEHADLRDALTVLTPDQLAKAWEMVAARHHRHFGRGGRHGMIGGRGGPGGPGGAPHAWGMQGPGHGGHGPDSDSAAPPPPGAGQQP